METLENFPQFIPTNKIKLYHAIGDGVEQSMLLLQTLQKIKNPIDAYVAAAALRRVEAKILFEIAILSGLEKEMEELVLKQLREIEDIISKCKGFQMLPQSKKGGENN